MQDYPKAAHKIIISGGVLKFVYHDDLRPFMQLGNANIRRASHVEPTPDGRWTADMSPLEAGVVLGPFDTRQQALTAETNWIAAHPDKL